MKKHLLIWFLCIASVLRLSAEEQVTLDIDTVVVTYQSIYSDSTANRFVYTFNFSRSLDYPSVLVDAILTKPMELVAGSYTLDNQLLEGLQLSRNQNDFESNLFTGSAYDWTAAELTLSPEGDQWRYTMTMTDADSNTYSFTLLQAPHIIHYPQPINSSDKPFADESKNATTKWFTLDTIIWDDHTFGYDSIIDIILSTKQADLNGQRPYIHLGMYAPAAYPDAGAYPVNNSEQSGSFSASVGRFGSVIIPCYAAIADENGYAVSIWYLVDGNIYIYYDQYGRPMVSGECTSHFGSRIAFDYQPGQTEALTPVTDNPSPITHKQLRDGRIVIIRGERIYNAQGALIK